MTKIAASPLLPANWFAVMCTIRQEPAYQFLGSEYRIAQHMAEKGLLQGCTKDRSYRVTDYGLRCYTANRLLEV